MLIIDPDSRIKIHEKMQENGVHLSGYVYEFPLHKLPLFKEHNDIELINTEYYCSSHIGLPIFFDMSDSEAMHVIDSFKKVLSQI